MVKPWRRAFKAAKQQPIVAAATIMRRDQIRALPAQRDWQSLAWEFFDQVGEFKQAVTWLASFCSRCVLYVGLADADGDGDPEPLPPEHPAWRPLNELFGGPEGHTEMIARAITQLSVPGETYIVGTDLPDRDKRTWLVCSNEELVRNNRAVKVRPPDSDQLVPIDVENSMIIRIWQQHGRRAWEADSSSKTALPLLDQICAIMSRARAELESRLAGAGMIEMSEGASLPAPPEPEDGLDPLHHDPDMAVLMDAMVTPIKNRDAASAVVPIIARVPEAVAGKAIKFHSFATKLDERLEPMLETALQRLGVTLDVSPERVTGGLGESNQWTGVVITEDEIRAYVQPKMALLVNALTGSYYRTALAEMKIPKPEDYRIWFSTAPLTQRPNRGPEAMQMYGMDLLSGEATRRETGFAEEDAPDAKEQLTKLLTKLALGSVDPAIIEPYLKLLGAQAIAVPAAPAVPAGSPPAALPPGTPVPPRIDNDIAPTSPGSPSNPAPPGTAQARADHERLHSNDQWQWWLTCVEGCTMRALEYAGNRLRGRTSRTEYPLSTVPPWGLHTVMAQRADTDLDVLLDGAYTMMRTILADQPAVQSTVDKYVRHLISQRLPHSRERLALALAQGGCLPTRVPKMAQLTASNRWIAPTETVL